MAVADKRFLTARLSFNIGPIGRGGNNADCNSGGSTWCADTKCGNGSCFGTSCSGGSCSVTKHEIDSVILVEEGELAALQKQLVAVVERFAAQKAG